MALTWEDNQEADRFLRAWLIARILVFFVQIPFRIDMYQKLQKAVNVPDRHDAVNNLIRLCHTRSWKMNQTLGRFLYCWFAIAFFLVYWYREHYESPLYLLSLVSITIFVIHMVLSYVLLRGILQGDAFEASAWRGGVSESQIAEHTREAPASEFKGTQCCFCFEDYDQTKKVRVLPCGHDYHSGCVDKWLNKKKACPLCLHEIDKPFSPVKPKDV